MYAHLAAYLPCSKETLLKRAKTLRVKEMDDKIKGPLEKLKDGRWTYHNEQAMKLHVLTVKNQHKEIGARGCWALIRRIVV